MIGYGKQTIEQKDIEAVVDVLKSPWLTQGPRIKEFEQCVVDYCGVNFGVACNSATSALHIACLALDIKPGDKVWTSAITFVASANCARYCGADLEFIDVDVDTGNISVTSLAKKLESAALQNKLPKVLIPVHFAGQPCDMAEIAGLSKKYGFRVIEDASHALGASYCGQKIGSCQHSDITVFSFHPVKMITTGEGGMAMTKSSALANQMRKYSCHGITKDSSEFIGNNKEAWFYEQQNLGFNFRMSELQAALGISQMARLDEWVSDRNRIIGIYQELLGDLNIKFLNVRAQLTCSYHLAVIQVAESLREGLYHHLIENGVGVQVHYIPVYKQPYYRNLLGQIELPGSEAFYNSVLTIPLYPGLEDKDVKQVAMLIKDFFV